MYFYAESDHHAIDLTLAFYGFEICDPGHSFGPALRDTYILHYIDKGYGCFCIQGRQYQLGPGDFFLIPPNIPVHYYADQEQPWTYFWLGLSGTKVQEYLSKSALLEAYVILEDKRPAIKQLGLLVKHTIYQAQAQSMDPNAYLQHYAQLYQVLYHLASHYPALTPKNTDPQYQLYLKTKHYLDIHYHQAVSIQALADQLAVNRSYLTSLFKRFDGQAPKAYLLQIRMQRAVQLLESTNEPIKAIANSVGYPDALVFSRAFKNHYGKAPSQWRVEDRNGLSQ